MQICRCFRDEDLRADRQPEFTQIDVEMSFVERDQVMAVMEGLTQRIFPLVGVEVHPPFDRYTYADVMARYGVDKPDLRASLEMVDLTRELGGSGFRAFRQTAEEGGAILGLAVPGAAGASRREVDEWAEQARAQGVGRRAAAAPPRRRAPVPGQGRAHRGRARSGGGASRSSPKATSRCWSPRRARARRRRWVSCACRSPRSMVTGPKATGCCG